MPPRGKPVKETVTYPSSKTKTAPFKPLSVGRPSGSDPGRATSQPTAKPPPAKRQKTAIQDDDDDEDDTLGADDDSDDLPENPLAAKPSKSTKRAPPKRKPPQRQASPMSISSSDHESPQRQPADPDPPPEPSQSDSIPTIPQPLLVRLLHEHFADPSTKIDKNAIQVLQKYFEVFIRETIARAALRKREEAEEGAVDEMDVSWLELGDLEKVAGGMMLDF